MGTAGSKGRKKRRAKSAAGHDAEPTPPTEESRPHSKSQPQLKQRDSSKEASPEKKNEDTSQVHYKKPAADGNQGSKKADPGKDSVNRKRDSRKPDDEKSKIAADDEMAGERQPSRSFSMEPKDIMISYSHLDKDMMRKIRDALEAAGIKVWVDEEGLKAGVEFFNKIGQAIVDAKLFLCLLSSKSVVSKYCKDELALAYVSSKPIFPCALETRDNIISLMDFGMRLQLAPVTWTMFLEEAAFNQSIMELVKNIQSKLAEMDVNKTAEADKRPQFKRQRSHLNLHSTPAFEPKETLDFWDKNFKEQMSIEWESFEEAFNSDYQLELDDMFKKVDQEWLLNILCNELDEDADGIIQKEHYDEFCTVNGEMSEFWLRVQEQALESYTMREVFSMDSTVRIDAIQNLSKFHSNSVLEALLDLCNDHDENVRAVAALSLARVAKPENKHAMGRMRNLLKDKDRLVRESGCLALGHIKAGEAVPELVNLWRNDAISNVREAAQIALEKIGGEEAEKAMHITKVLSEEIKKLAEKPCD